MWPPASTGFPWDLWSRRARREKGRQRWVRARLKLSNDTAVWQRVRPHEAHKDRVHNSQACALGAGSPRSHALGAGLRPRRNPGMDASRCQRSSRRTHAVAGVANDGSRVGGDAPLDSFKDTPPDPTPGFLPPEHEGRSADPTHCLSGRATCPPGFDAGSTQGTRHEEPGERQAAHQLPGTPRAQRPPVPSAKSGSPLPENALRHADTRCATHFAQA